MCRAAVQPFLRRFEGALAEPDALRPLLVTVRTVRSVVALSPTARPRRCDPIATRSVGAASFATAASQRLKVAGAAPAVSQDARRG